MTARYQFLPWVRQGAAGAFRNLDNPESPVLSRSDGKPLSIFPVALMINNRPEVEVTLRMAGPGEVAGIDPRVTIRIDPPAGSADFEPNYFASIEFDPPEFPWLFTPAAAGSRGRIRPWLALVVVEVGDDTRLDPPVGPGLPVLTTPVSGLPDLVESWVWAHAQAVQTGPDQPVEQILSSVPQQNLSRLICPRRLRPTTRYLACLVPAFDAGRKAGLEEPVSNEDRDRLLPAWTAGQGNVRLPVYYHWQFTTGAGGDFESLARRLQGRALSSDVGRRPLLVRDQPYGLPDLDQALFEGALVSPAEVTPPPVDAAFQDALRALINLGAEDRVLTPPLYARWQAAQTTIPGQAELPAWLRDLNLDPAARGAAGMGARVVQRHQEQLVASAWNQFGDLPSVIHLERRLSVSVTLLQSVIRRRVDPMEPAQLVQFLGPAHARLRASQATLRGPSETLRASLSRQGLPAAFSSGTFRRTTRPAGSLSRRGGFSTPVNLQRAATRLGSRVPAINPAPGTLGLVTTEKVKAIILTGPLSPAQLRYREAVADVQFYFQRFMGGSDGPQGETFAFSAAFKASLVANLDPRQNAARRFYAPLQTADGGAVQPPEVPGASVITGPSFPQPMYEALRDLSPEFLLPGAGEIQQDTVTLLNSNPRFIEAYMLGLNHELAGELLWREFPGDLRHTYFRAFWDTRGSAQPMQQLGAIHEFDPALNLGDHFGGGSTQLVLLIRGELLQRYPDTLIYAVRAKTIRSLGDEEKMPIFRGRIDPDITFLGFNLTADQARGGAADPGWFFVIQEQPGAPRFGMDETRATELITWNDLAWSDLHTTPGAHLKLADLALPQGQPPPGGPQWGFNAAHMAAILRQRPVRIAMHARYLLPPVEEAPPQPPGPPQPPQPPRPPRPPVTPIDPPVPPVVHP